jgi:hypothetical protein
MLDIVSFCSSGTEFFFFKTGLDISAQRCRCAKETTGPDPTTPEFTVTTPALL